MRKILPELLKLIWKALRLVLWKWLGPIMKRFAWLGLIVVGVVTLVILVVARL